MSTLADFAAALRDASAQAPAALGATAVRFDVHRNTRMLALVDAMVATYPVTRAMVGDAFFRAMARECVLHAPPRTPVMTEVVQALPGVMGTFAPVQAMPWLQEVATVEALRVASYHAADAAPIDAASLARWLDAPDALAAAHIHLHPAARWFRARHAAHALWAAHHGHDDVARVDLSAIDIDAAEDVLVTRPHWDVHVSTAPAGLCDVLDALAEGHTLGEAMAHALASAPGALAADLFTALLAHALVVAIITAP